MTPPASPIPPTAAGAEALPSDRSLIRARLWVGVLIALVLLAAGAIVYSTHIAPWVFTDSVAYLLSAQNLARGGGLGTWTAGGRFASLPSPGYPGLLALLTLLGLDVIDAARWIGVAGFAALVGLVGYFGARISRSVVFGVTLPLAVLVQPALIHLYSGAMSDPLFITVSAGSLLILGWSASTGSRSGLLAAGILAGAATLIRHVGAALVLAGPVCILVVAPFSWKDRAKRALAFAAWAALPAVAWQAVAQITAAAGPARGLRLPERSLWQALTPFRIALVDLLWSQVPWMARIQALPYRTKLLLLVMLFAAGAFGLVWLRLRKDPQSRRVPFSSAASLAVAAGLYLASHAGVVALAFLFTDPTPDIDGRTLLAPMIVSLWIWWLTLPLLAAELWPRFSRRAALLFVVLEATALVTYLQPSLDVMQRLHADGDGYTSRTWASSGVIVLARDLPADMPLISNESAAVHFLTGRPAYDLPELIGLGQRPLDARFGDDQNDPIERVFREREGALVLFDSAYWQLDRVYPGEADQRLKGMTAGLKILGDAWDGAIYAYPRSP